MSLQIIGAGWGRTGTVSLRTALTILGHTPHHMSEVFAHPEQAELFVEAADDPTFDWQRIYAPTTPRLSTGPAAPSGANSPTRTRRRRSS